MANKKSARTNKHKPAFLNRSVSFGEERNGVMRISRPGTSPTSPPHQRYLVTSPPPTRWAELRSLEGNLGMPKTQAAPRKPNAEATRLCQDHFTFPSIELPTFGTSHIDADMYYSDAHFKPLDLLNSLNSALIVTIMRRSNGDIEFQDGASWHKLPTNAEKRIRLDTSAVLSSPTAGFKTLPALLQNGNLTSTPNSYDFKFENTAGWVRALKEHTCEGDYMEKWVYLGEESIIGIETVTNCLQYGPPSDDESELFKRPTSPAKGTKSPTTKSYMRCIRPGQPSRAPKTPTSSSQVIKSTTKKAKKNRKAREKKAHEKRNIGKREKLPYIPEHALEEKTLTRSRAKLHHVHAKEFYAMPT